MDKSKIMVKQESWYEIAILWKGEEQSGVRD